MAVVDADIPTSAQEAVEKHKSTAEKNELLMWAAARGLLPDVVELVCQGAELGCRDKGGHTPLHFAAAHGSLEVVEFLAGRGADVDGDDGAGRTPLHHAALGGHAGVVRYLCPRVAWLNTSDGDDNTPLHLAARAGAAGAVQALAAAGAKLDLLNKHGLSALGEAVVGGHVGAVQALLDKRALATITARGYSLLHIAAGLGHAGVLERLIVEGRRPDLNDASNAEGLTPMHAAAMTGSTACVDLMLARGGKADIRSVDGELPADLVPAAPTVPAASGSDQSSKALAALKERLLKAAGKSAKQQQQPAKAADASQKPQAAAVGAAGKGSKAKAKEEEKEETLAERFARMSPEEQRRRVDAYARMSESEASALSGSSALPAGALEALSRLRRAAALRESWQAVDALRRDSQFQEDVRDPHVAEAIEHLKTPGADPDRYRGDRQVWSVLAKLNKLHTLVTRLGVPKVTLDDLRAAPSGPNSSEHSASQVTTLTAAVNSLRADVVAAILGQAPRGAGSSTAAAAGGSKPRSGMQQRDGGDAESEEEEEDEGGDEQSKGAKGAGGADVGEQQAEAERSWGSLFREMGKQLLHHVMRALFMGCLMMLAMWMSGMLPDQVKARQMQREAAAAMAATAARASGVDGGAAAAEMQLLQTRAQVEGAWDADFAASAAAAVTGGAGGGAEGSLLGGIASRVFGSAGSSDAGAGSGLEGMGDEGEL